MLNALDSFVICTKFKMKNFMDGLKKDESGVAAFVATVLLILIVVLLCALFWEKIQEWFNNMWNTITGKSGGIS